MIDKYATMTQSFGPEARGSACSSQLVVSDDRVLYPYITRPEILVSMSQEAYDKYEPELRDNGILIIDTDLVKPRPARGKIKMYSVPSTRFAEELGNRIIANLVMLGFFTAVTKIRHPDAMKKALPGLVPDRFLDLNIRAFDKGYDYGTSLTKNSIVAKKGETHQGENRIETNRSFCLPLRNQHRRNCRCQKSGRRIWPNIPASPTPRIMSTCVPIPDRTRSSMPSKNKNWITSWWPAALPTLHETTFRNAAKEAGINEFQCEIANIREQCSWVHKDKDKATDKADQDHQKRCRTGPAKRIPGTHQHSRHAQSPRYRRRDRRHSGRSRYRQQRI